VFTSCEAPSDVIKASSVDSVDSVYRVYVFRYQHTANLRPAFCHLGPLCFVRRYIVTLSEKGREVGR
jgi:hypothetical protein